MLADRNRVVGLRLGPRPDGDCEAARRSSCSRVCARQGGAASSKPSRAPTTWSRLSTARPVVGFGITPRLGFSIHETENQGAPVTLTH